MRTSVRAPQERELPRADVLVYGDHADEVDPREDLQTLAVRPPDRWTLVETGRLVQGLLDAEFAELGCDELTPLSRACGEAMLALAAGRPWIDALRGVPLPSRVTLKVPEGYAFYAVYPELYAQAAGAAPYTAIGIRSIGTSLAAVVAARSGSGAPFFVRPVGHPFHRELRLGPQLDSALRGRGPFAIVDEGPGLSGSSFLCVARALIERGAEPGDIHLFPSHPGAPGAHASPEDRALWERLPKHQRRFESLVHDVPRWCEDLTGPPIAPLEDLSGGAWRQRLPRPWPPAHVQQERRKLLLRTARGAFLLKFAGLGRSGDETLRRAAALSEAGFAPDVLGLRNGFLVQRWAEGVPLTPGSESTTALLDRVAGYVAFRSRHLPAAADAGASPRELLRMAEHNGGRELPDWRSRVEALAHDVVRIETDNRMHAWEWLHLADGRILKTDGADHCRAHDLVGCQDAAWDLAAAAIELGLDERALVQRFRANGGRGATGEVLRFSRLCYLAFQLGYWTLANDAARAAHYRELLRAQ